MVRTSCGFAVLAGILLLALFAYGHKEEEVTIEEGKKEGKQEEDFGAAKDYIQATQEIETMLETEVPFFHTSLHRRPSRRRVAQSRFTRAC